MNKRIFSLLIVLALFLGGLILLGAECEYDEFGYEKDESEAEWGYDEKGNRLILPEPDLECWPIGSDVGPWDTSEEEVTTIFGVEAIEKCKSVECKTPEGIEWMSVVNFFKDAMESLGWTKSSGQNIYYYEWQEFTIWYQGQNKEKQQSYRLEYCDVVPEKDL